MSIEETLFGVWCLRVGPCDDSFGLEFRSQHWDGFRPRPFLVWFCSRVWTFVHIGTWRSFNFQSFLFALTISCLLRGHTVWQFVVSMAAVKSLFKITTKKKNGPLVRASSFTFLLVLVLEQSRNLLHSALKSFSIETMNWWHRNRRVSNPNRSNDIVHPKSTIHFKFYRFINRYQRRGIGSALTHGLKYLKLMETVHQLQTIQNVNGMRGRPYSRQTDPPPLICIRDLHR